MGLSWLGGGEEGGKWGLEAVIVARLSAGSSRSQQLCINDVGEYT